MTDPINDRDAQLAPRLTPEFLETLVEAARVVGWSVDYVEVASFVKEVHRRAGMTITREQMEPYEDS